MVLALVSSTVGAYTWQLADFTASAVGHSDPLAMGYRAFAILSIAHCIHNFSKALGTR